MRAWNRVTMAGAAIAVLLTTTSSNPSAQEKPDYLLKEQVRLVIVPVTVKDRHGNLVDDLTQEKFQVFEEGRERPIQFFSNESVPLAAAVLLDTGMSGANASSVRATLRTLSSAFGPADEEALDLFDNTIRQVQDFTSQSDLLRELGEKSFPAGKGPAVLGGPFGLPATINGVSVDRPGTAPVLSPPGRDRNRLGRRERIG